MTVYQIGTLTGAVTDHTITDEVDSLYFKEVLTAGIGQFSFTLPAYKGDDVVYSDIALNDRVKIYIADDTIPAAPNFWGRVSKIEHKPTKKGWVRVISGMSDGEILLRRHKTNKFYDAVDASTIVTEWASDLGISGAGDITVDTTDVTLQVRTKTYFDLLQWISDYYDAGGSVQKDFLVNTDGHLHWKSRPWRTAGVETLTVGDNILSYELLKGPVEKVFNSITVKGVAEAPYPRNHDDWTDALDNWTASSGTLALNADCKYGDYSIECDSPAGSAIAEFKRTLPVWTIRDTNKLRYWVKHEVAAASSVVRILCPDTSNYYETGQSTGVAWAFQDFNIGPEYVYHVDHNPDGIWTATSSPNWWDMQGIQFRADAGMVSKWIKVDGIHWFPDRWTDTATNAASKTSYGQRDMEVTDEKFHDDSECEHRSETLLYQMKDPATQIIMTVKGNNNIKCGDRLSITLPADGISAANYDVIAVEQIYVRPNNWTTKATMINTANIRDITMPNPVVQHLKRLNKTLRRSHLTELEVTR